jgi:hypothetical protein
LARIRREEFLSAPSAAITISTELFKKRLKFTLFLHDYPAPGIPNIEKEYALASPFPAIRGNPSQIHGKTLRRNMHQRI